jgi:hypothetical protein
MAEIFIDCFHHEGSRGAITGLNLTVSYSGITAEVSVPDMPPLSEPGQSEAVRAAILRLGQAIVEAAQSPQGIHAHPHQKPQS